MNWLKYMLKNMDYGILEKICPFDKLELDLSSIEPVMAGPKRCVIERSMIFVGINQSWEVLSSCLPAILDRRSR